MFVLKRRLRDAVTENENFDDRQFTGAPRATYIYNVNAVFSWMRQAIDGLEHVHSMRVRVGFSP